MLPAAVALGVLALIPVMVVESDGQNLTGPEAIAATGRADLMRRHDPPAGHLSSELGEVAQAASHALDMVAPSRSDLNDMEELSMQAAKTLHWRGSIPESPASKLGHNVTNWRHSQAAATSHLVGQHPAPPSSSPWLKHTWQRAENSLQAAQRLLHDGPPKPSSAQIRQTANRVLENAKNLASRASVPHNTRRNKSPLEIVQQQLTNAMHSVEGARTSSTRTNAAGPTVSDARRNTSGKPDATSLMEAVSTKGRWDEADRVPDMPSEQGRRHAQQEGKTAAVQADDALELIDGMEGDFDDADADIFASMGEDLPASLIQKTGKGIGALPGKKVPGDFAEAVIPQKGHLEDKLVDTWLAERNLTNIEVDWHDFDKNRDGQLSESEFIALAKFASGAPRAQRTLTPRALSMHSSTTG